MYIILLILGLPFLGNLFELIVLKRMERVVLSTLSVNNMGFSVFLGRSIGLVQFILLLFLYEYFAFKLVGFSDFLKAILIQLIMVH